VRYDTLNEVSIISGSIVVFVVVTGWWIFVRFYKREYKVRPEQIHEAEVEQGVVDPLVDDVTDPEG